MEKGVEYQLEVIKALKPPKKTLHSIEEYLNFKKSTSKKGKGMYGREFALRGLGALIRVVNKPLPDLTRQDLLNAIPKMRKLRPNFDKTGKSIVVRTGEELGNNTRLTYYCYIKEYYASFLQQPKKVEWLKPHSYAEDFDLNKMLYGSEIKKMIDGSGSIRDSAIIAALFASGARSNKEFFKILKIGSLTEDKEHALFYYDLKESKTKDGKRRIYLSGCGYTWIKLWMRVHPDVKNPDAPPFVCLKRHYGRKLTRGAFDRRFKAIGIKVGIPEEKLFPHNLRHSRALYLNLKGYPELVINRLMGWADGSKMNARYAKIAQSVVEEVLLEKEGLKNGNEPAKNKYLMEFEELMNVRECPNCGRVVYQGAVSCDCGAINEAAVMVEPARHQEHHAQIFEFAARQKDAEIKKLEARLNALEAKAVQERQ